MSQSHPIKISFKLSKRQYLIHSGALPGLCIEIIWWCLLGYLVYSLLGLSLAQAFSFELWLPNPEIQSGIMGMAIVLCLFIVYIFKLPFSSILLRLASRKIPPHEEIIFFENHLSIHIVNSLNGNSEKEEIIKYDYIKDVIPFDDVTVIRVVIPHGFKVKNITIPIGAIKTDELKAITL